MKRIAALIAVLFSTTLCRGKDVGFELLFGKFSKSYHDFFYVKMTEEAREGIDAAISGSSALPKEDRIRFFTMIYLHYNLDGELFSPVRKAIRVNDDMDALIEHAQTIKRSNMYRDEKRLEHFVKFIESIKKAHRIQ